MHCPFKVLLLTQRQIILNILFLYQPRLLSDNKIATKYSTTSSVIHTFRQVVLAQRQLFVKTEFISVLIVSLRMSFLQPWLNLVFSHIRIRFSYVHSFRHPYVWFLHIKKEHHELHTLFWCQQCKLHLACHQQLLQFIKCMHLTSNSSCHKFYKHVHLTDVCLCTLEVCNNLDKQVYRDIFQY